MSDDNTTMRPESPLNKKTRESGFYWCNLFRNKWVVCQWDRNIMIWRVPGRDRSFEDSDFEEIDERRITREEPLHPNYTGFSGTIERIPQNE